MTWRARWVPLRSAMKRHRRWIPLLVVALLGLLGGGALMRPPGPYAGRVLYVRLRLAPYFGSYKEIQYWIDSAAGRIRYAEMVPSSPTVRAFVNGVPVQPSAPQWFVVALGRRPDGRCGITYTTLLDSSERGMTFSCAALLSLRDPQSLQTRALSLWRRYRAAARPVAGSADLASVQVPATASLVPLLMEDPSITPDARRRPGALLLNTRTGQPISLSGYARSSMPVATEHILSVRMLRPHTLPGDFFDAPAFSWPDRAPALYQWLHNALPWHP